MQLNVENRTCGCDVLVACKNEIKKIFSNVLIVSPLTDGY